MAGTKSVSTRIGVDTGGTFTDFVHLTADGIAVDKRRSTPDDPSQTIGRIASASAPWLAGGLVKTRGYPAALSLMAATFLLAAALWIFIPETKGRTLQERG